jgi:hypothetical protein
VWEQELQELQHQEQEIAIEDLHLGWTGYKKMKEERLLGIST